MGIPFQEEFDVFNSSHAVSVDVLHFLDLDSDRLGLLALAVAFVVLTERKLCPGDRGAVVAGGDKSFQPEPVEVSGEVLEEVAFEGVVAVAIDDLASEGVGVEFEVGFNFFLNVNILALRCFAWMVTTSRGQSEVEFTGDQIDHRFEVAH